MVGNILTVFVFLLCESSWSVLAQPTEYDFIIVGGGTAGCLLAERLSAVPDWTVLLVEAGGEENALQDIPLFASLLQFTPANWGYKTEKSSTACLGLVDGRCDWPRGRVLGGSSVLNYMVFTRGSPKDYDGWKELGNEGWGYDDVLPYFRKFENMLIPELANNTMYHSTEGELAISYPPYHSQSASAFVAAGVERGYKNIDYNGESEVGYSYIQSTTKNGMRFSSNSAFLERARNRENLHVLKRSLATKILIHPENNTAYGIEFKLLGLIPTEARAKKEVIVSAGAINSPQLLMLSGIGPKQDLEELGIPVIKNLKVGFNLQDHISLGNLYFTTNKSATIRFDSVVNDVASISQYLINRTGILSVPGGIEAIGFEDIGDDDGSPEIELLFVGTTTASLILAWIGWGGRLDIYFEAYMSLMFQNAFSIFPILMYPKSRGRLVLKSKNPTEKPLIYHNYLTEPEDVDVIIEGIKRAIQLTKTEAFQKYGAELYKVPLPPCKDHEFASDDYWKCSLRYMTYTVFHHCGTCKMGPDSDPDAVVDHNLRVRGIKNLRVVDSSIIPVIPAAHLSAPTYMIAEKGAAMIVDYWKDKD